MPAPVIEWVRPGVGFTPAAAASFRRAEASWRAKTGRAHIDCNSSYRDYGLQLSMYQAWTAWAEGRGPKPNHSRAIHPDHSKHSQGLGLDSDDWTVPGFIAHMADHGWIRTAANDPTERHHFEYQEWRDNHRNRPAGAATGTTPQPPRTVGEDVMYIRAINAGNYARAGHIYTNDTGGHWRGVSNLEGEGYIVPLARAGVLPLVEFNGSDLDLLFAINGVWEQETLPGSVKWRNGSVPLIGLGVMSGRLMYPGSVQPVDVANPAGPKLGAWHYPRVSA